jgi:hypothetical protein
LVIFLLLLTLINNGVKKNSNFGII